MKATHFTVFYEGVYSGHSYRYEETVPVADYQCKSPFFLKLMGKEKRQAIELMNDAEVGFHWEWSEGAERVVIDGVSM